MIVGLIVVALDWRSPALFFRASQSLAGADAISTWQLRGSLHRAKIINRFVRAWQSRVEFMATDRPIVFLAFADSRSDLSSLKVEGWSLKDQFEELKQRGVIADLVVEEKASLERIYAVFQKHRDRIAIFHFGGHADGDRLFLESAFEPRPAYAEGLATLLGQQRGLKLVFLNGCSTRPQVKRLLDAGVPAVIATARPIDDRVATEFAVAFYQGPDHRLPPRERKITGGCSLAMAFAQAEGFDQRRTRSKSPGSRGLVTHPRGRHRREGFPWKVEYRPGSEHIACWNLFEDDPLFGLPPLPKTSAGLASPYRGLEYFQRREARIFFGRGREIRELYDKVRRSGEAGESDVLLLCGQTGVGKSSVLDAGLVPRLEQVCRVIGPLRRSADAACWARSVRRLGRRPTTIRSTCEPPGCVARTS